jgi:hypothetical protein
MKVNEILNEAGVKYSPSKLKAFAKEKGIKLVKQENGLISLVDKKGTTVGTFNPKNEMLDTKLDTYKFIQF